MPEQLSLTKGRPTDLYFNGTNGADISDYTFKVRLKQHYGQLVAELTTANGGLIATDDGGYVIKILSAHTAVLPVGLTAVIAVEWTSSGGSITEEKTEVPVKASQFVP